MKKKKVVILSLMFFAVVCLALFARVLKGNETSVVEEKTTESKTVEGQTEDRRKLIIDTDTGADDASALILAAKQPNVEILGVTVLAGNVDLEQGAKNALMSLELAGRDVPVYKGSGELYDGTKITPCGVFGDDGMGDEGLIHPTDQAEDKDAIDFIIDTVKENPGEVEIVCLGPATNVAKAIDKAPEVMKDVKMIWSMGTAGFGHGNASPVAEFNVYTDAPAYKVMLDSDLPITIVSMDMCSEEAEWTAEQFDRLEAKGELGSFIKKSFGKIREFYKGNGSETVMNCDSVTMMCVLRPDFIKESIKTHANCITQEGETYAQVIFYKEGFTYDLVKNDFDYNVTLVTEVDKTSYFDNYIQMIE